MSQSKADKIRAIKSSPQYIQEKYEHDRSCDHAKNDAGLPAGKIQRVVTTPYGLRGREDDCRFCKRLRLAKERRVAGGN